jgi:MFS family permease
MRSLRLEKQIPIGVWGVSIGCLLIAISTSMTFSVSPFFVTKSLGLSTLALGLIEGFSEALAQISKLVAGYAGDFFRRKKIPLMIGAVLAAVSKPIFIMANGALMISLSKAIERISNGIFATPRDAYVAEAVHPSIKGQALGLMMSLKTIGCTIGSLFITGLALYGLREGMEINYRLLLWFGFVPCLLSLVVLYKFVPELDKEDEGALSAKKEDARLSWKDCKQLSSGYWSLVIVASVFMCARFSDGFLCLRMEQLGLSQAWCLSLIGIFNAVSAVCCIPIGHLSDRFDRSKILYFSFITLVLANVFLMSNDLIMGWIGVLMWGAQRGTSQVLFAAIIADEAPRKIMGTAMGIFYLLTGIISIVAGAVAGHLSRDSIEHAFSFGMVVSLVALVALYIRNERIGRRRKLETPDFGETLPTHA